MATLRLHRQRWQAKLRIPQSLRASYGGREFVSRSLGTPDKREALVRAAAWEAEVRAEWLARQGRPIQAPAVRELYQQTRHRAEAGEFRVYMAGEDDPAATGIEHELEQIAELVPEGAELDPATEARVAALQDARLALEGQLVPRRPFLELSFDELAASYMSAWRADKSLKAANTGQQKEATFRLFSGYFRNRPIREAQKPDAAGFADALRKMHPDWARKPSAMTMTWPELQRDFGGRPTGMSDATVNRHMGALMTLWAWAEERGHCSGKNPFQGFRRALKDGRNAHRYLAWEADELARLFDPPPKRADVTEVMLVALYSGMRLNEIASLTVGQIHTAGPIPFVRVVDAKTPAGNRDVPIHPALSWLVARAVGKPGDRIWPGFTDEGPGKKPGGDVGKEFSRFKAAKGFTDRRKVFHSFRKNFVGQLELAGVPETEVAQIVGHEKRGMTFGTYGTSLSLERRAQIVSLVEYPSLQLK